MSRMPTRDPVTDIGYVGPKPLEWTNALARITVTAAITGVRKDGKIDMIERTESRDFRLKMKESDHTDSHRHVEDRFTMEGGHMETYPVILTPDETGGFVVECPAIPGCMSEGETEEEALENIKEAIQGCLAARSELGLELGVDIKYVEI